VVLHESESAKPKGGELIQDGAFAGNRIWENNIEGRKPVGRHEKERVAEIEDLADFAAAEFLYSRKFE